MACRPPCRTRRTRSSSPAARPTRATRHSTLEFDRDVFTGGLADPDLWSRRAWNANFGVNWYLNRYVKVYLDWQHTEFGDPVIFRRQPDQKQLTNELFWLRMQLYF